MRRLHGGLLTALVLLVAGCGSGQSADDAAPAAEPASIAVPTLAVSARTPTAPAAVDTLTVLVTSAGGVDSPGLDAAVAVLSSRPATEVVVVATAAPSSTVQETGATAQVRDGHTMSGYPAHVVNASAADAVGIALDALALSPDLVVVGIDDGAALGAAVRRSPSVGAAMAAARRGIPAIAVTADDQHGTDLAAGGLLLSTMFDLGLDDLLQHDRARVVTIPSCADGLVRGPVEVDVATTEPVGGSNCLSPAGEHADDVPAHAAGYATVVDLRP